MLPYGYVQPVAKRGLSESHDVGNLHYEYFFDVGILVGAGRGENAQQTAETTLLTLIDLAETVIRANPTIGATAQDIVIDTETEIIRGNAQELGEIAWGLLRPRAQAYETARP